MSGYDLNVQQTQDVVRIIHCAYLAAVGDSALSDIESDGLFTIRSKINSLILAKEAIEYYESTGDFEGALEIHAPFPCSIASSSDMAHDFQLLEISNKRDHLQSLEEIIKLEENTALKVKGEFLQKVAVSTCMQVISSNKIVMNGEIIAIQNMCKKWSVDIGESMGWLMAIANPILSGEDPGDYKTLEKRENFKYSIFVDVVLNPRDDAAEYIMEELEKFDEKIGI